MTRGERQKLEDLLAILAFPAGQRFLANLIYGHCGLMRTAPLEALAMAYHEGRRAIGSELNEAVVNANRGAVPALLGTFLAEQDRAARDLDDRASRRADGIDPGRERDEWGEPIHDAARRGPDDRTALVTITFPDDGSALG
jgi:hypothetical protein